jgi:hypothetical protein
MFSLLEMRVCTELLIKANTHSVSSAASYVLLIETSARCEDAAKTRLRSELRENVPCWNYLFLRV